MPRLRRSAKRQPRLKLSVGSNVPARVRTAMQDALYTFNVQATGVSDGRMLSLLLRDARGRLQAGLLGHTWAGCLTVTELWVHSRQRGRGLGTQLMAKAEAIARKRGCVLSFLSTHTFQARPFYERLGYRVVAQLKDYPLGHGQVFMRKRLGTRKG